jgi:hypothetical protein
MIGFEAALETARRLLAKTHRPHEVEIVVSETRESKARWAFVYQSTAYLRTGRVSDQLAGNSPILVEKSDGRASYGRTDVPIDEQLT